MDRLQELLDTMDVPTARKNDMGWLARNLAIRNESHEHFREAISLVKASLDSGTTKG